VGPAYAYTPCAARPSPAEHTQVESGIPLLNCTWPRSPPQQRPAIWRSSSQGGHGVGERTQLESSWARPAPPSVPCPCPCPQDFAVLGVEAVTSMLRACASLYSIGVLLVDEGTHVLQKLGL
jgi:hypothetical protein